MQKEKRWNIDRKKLVDKNTTKVLSRFNTAKAQMKQRTYHHELYGLLAKNKSIHEWSVKRGRTKYFSEGSTQYILRKVLANTIQRVPDGELTTQYDKATVESVLLDYIFDRKVMNSEIEGQDMMSNLVKAFKMSFIYAFAPVRTGFEKDIDGDARIKFDLCQWSDIFINPDCTDICQAQVVYHRHYMSKDDVLAMLDQEGNITDSTYHEDAIHCLIDEDMFTGRESDSQALADKMKSVSAQQSIELITEYRRGSDEFITYLPCLKTWFRKVPNYDPRKGIPWNFLVLDPDMDFPIGVSQVEFLLADQQFNDLFQTSAYKNLLLAMEPPIMVAGWETNPASYRFEPRAIWNLGNNPNQAKVEPVKIENNVLNGWTNTREAVAAAMVRNLNVADGTIAKDAGAGYSKTAPGVDQQREEKTININQYQKRVETFVQDWACQALRMYINSMHGKHDLIVNEDTRRRLADVGGAELINDNKVTVDFDNLSIDTIEFEVRAGSLIQRKEEQELDRLTAMAQPLIQNLNGWSEENRRIMENDVLLPVTRRMLELAGTDISNTLAESLSTQIAKNMMASMQQQIDQQAAQMNTMQGQIDQTQEQLAQGTQNGEQLDPTSQVNPDNTEAQSIPMPEEDNTFAEPTPPLAKETAGNQVKRLDDLMLI